ncbi:hypothetical protein CRE_14676 [Caenorhabditis remanei]|uniref:Uncharacterized protein n=1 Tax=Caenorhabditis remanei TaxID=31234 RepID=E3M9I1_CAERE|nr:hypothetical protein CRE_14676 [Caenorhabditis remanei]
MASSGSGGPPPTEDQLYDAFKTGLKSGNEEDKKTIKKILAPLCTAFLYSKDYKSGDKTKSSYKLCCETVDYCSFYYQDWFLMLGTGVACLILYIIIMMIVICFFKRKNKSGGGGGATKPMKTGKTSTGKKGKGKRTTGGLDEVEIHSFDENC